jgi:hypothetical protein
MVLADGSVEGSTPIRASGSCPSGKMACPDQQSHSMITIALKDLPKDKINQGETYE